MGPAGRVAFAGDYGRDGWLWGERRRGKKMQKLLELN